MRIVGLDIRPDRVSYSLTILEGDEIRTMIVPEASLIEVLQRIEPDLIAIDDESEFRDLDRIASLTGATIARSGRRGQSVRLAAREAGIREGSHPSPSRTSALVAKLAAMGIYEVILEGARETVVRISPARSSYKGGRESKYRRSLRNFLEHARSEIEKALRSAGIEFDVYRRGRSYEIHAYERFFRVREALRGLNFPDVRVDIRAARPRRVPIRGKFIVGVDPGIHVGLAFLDIYGRLVHSVTLEGGRESVIAYIKSIGEPIVLAVDVPEVPDFVKRISSALGAPVYAPNKPISVEEKREIAQSFGLRGSAHERDALAAAAKAYYALKPKIDRSIRIAKERGIPAEEIVYHVARNRSVSEVVSERGEERPSEYKPKRPKTVEELEREIESLRSEIARLRRAYEAARSRLEEYALALGAARAEAAKEALISVLSDSIGERAKALEEEISKLRGRIESLESLIASISSVAAETLEGAAIGKYLEDLTEDSLESLKPASISEGDAIFVRSAKFDKSGLEAASKARYIFAPRSQVRALSRALSRDVIPREEFPRRRLGPFVIFRLEDLENALRRLERSRQAEAERELKKIIFELSGEHA